LNPKDLRGKLEAENDRENGASAGSADYLGGLGGSRDNHLRDVVKGKKCCRSSCQNKEVGGSAPKKTRAGTGKEREISTQ
jgi:hypothetical protein